MYDFINTEKEILKFWKEKKIFEKLRKKNKGKKRWSFIDGPITANNPMGVHHAWGRTYKDVFQRFKAMQGHELRYQNGFDSQGLWVEREEEKDLGLKDKKDIENFGVLNFVKSCRKRVERFSKIQEEQSIKLGQWMDWDNSYYTMSDSNQLHNWFLIKKYYENKWLYKGNDCVPWCWRCGTASSKHDIVTEGYKEVTHKALFMRFPLSGKKNEYFLIFTTTPWTVPANVVIAVNEKVNYAKIENEGKYYWIAEKRVQELKGKYKIIEKKKGKQLEGIKYDMPYSDFEQQKKSPHKIVLWELASEEEGTGIVHVAPGCGAEDHDLGKKTGLPSISPLNDAGIYDKNFGNFSGKKYDEVNILVLKDLEERGFVYKIELYKHRYPHCWRCGQELVFRLVDEWYIKCDKIRKKLIDENKKIKWWPEYGKIRQEDWFENMSDWLISRKRYWGLPLPIWECSCGNVNVIGSLKELKEKAVDKKKVDSLPEIHRPWIDEIKIRCSKCGKEVSRIPDVGDAWLDAGIVPFSTLNYLNDNNYWKKWWPADLISENMPGQFRGWFNALFWASVTITGKAPFKSLFGYESLKDEKGEEMHKSKGNAIWFDEAVEKIGADTMRLLYCLQDPSQELKFGFHVAKEPKNNINIFYNLGRLIEKSNAEKPSAPEDKWIISKLNALISYVTEELENLHPHNATRALQNFWLNDFSRGYIQIVRERISNEDKKAKAAIKEIYVTLLKLCAPIIPFITEKIWQELRKKGIVKEESVHLSAWPKADRKKIDKTLEKEFGNVLIVIEKGLAERDKLQIGLRWPLAKAEIFVRAKEPYRELKNIIKTQLNVKEVEFKSPKLKKDESYEEYIKLDTTQTPELEAEGYARETARQVQDFRKKLGLQKKDKIGLYIITDENFKKILESQKNFIKDRTNSKKVEILIKADQTFKNQTSFSVKDKRGEIAIIVTNR
ncbi:MAG: isoleucine--tRNA ligase [Candidatus Pacearchaeota archaeon]|nr:isoleucine--tRNA ligase [Candidatus Pacearchaeota archaeon]